MDEDERERPDLPTPGDDVGGDELVEGDEEVDDLDRDAHIDAPLRTGGSSSRRPTRTGVPPAKRAAQLAAWAWWALIITTVGVGWALVLGTVFIVRSGDRTAELLSLFEEGQQQREAASGGAQQSQKERQAALKTAQQESQTFRAQELAALADQAQSNAEVRQALADAGLAVSRADTADSESRKADAEAALAQAETETEARKANAQGADPAAGSDRQLQAETLAVLAESIEGLQAAIKKIDRGGSGACTDPGARFDPIALRAALPYPPVSSAPG